MLTRYRNSDPDDGLSSGGNSRLNIGCEKFFLQGYRGRMYFSSSFSYAHRKGGLKGSSLQSSSFECSNRWNRRKTLKCLEKKLQRSKTNIPSYLKNDHPLENSSNTLLLTKVFPRFFVDEADAREMAGKDLE